MEKNISHYFSNLLVTRDNDILMWPQGSFLIYNLLEYEQFKEYYKCKYHGFEKKPSSIPECHDECRKLSKPFFSFNAWNNKNKCMCSTAEQCKKQKYQGSGSSIHKIIY